MKTEQISIVLVEPQGPLNIGSVSRAMMNFGFSRLVLVNPQCDHLSLDALRMAVKTKRLLEEAVVVDTLAEALEGVHYAFGTTRRFGKYRNVFFTPDELSEKLHPMGDEVNAALVFGREDKGLKTEELDLCQYFITLPTDEAYPSMNLAQAATVCMYEVRKRFAGPTPEGIETRVPATNESLERMLRHMQKTLLDIEYLDPLSPDHLLRTYRRIFGQSDITEREVSILQGLWSRIDWTESERIKWKKRVEEEK
ncbi:RNA methyltransferase [Desulfoluna spongiiphila]|uniref:tRNA (cytidine/uridine-2'-O-)-methyltransferase TrmJ n=1 Tax=Desulfoluna spongiiphila TaxID=419481 RepID=A0A1G5D900_9BACT|nr:RNA methyltransferase [Desulfoluna spongiiphila]SCY11094.1 tRNA/rRNA methyltransferase [Desulfoluna spongiiphila]VVS95271.1 rna methyltransferase trmh group 1 [Desulfoluna spongiiphila]